MTIEEHPSKTKTTKGTNTRVHPSDQSIIFFDRRYHFKIAFPQADVSLELNCMTAVVVTEYQTSVFCRWRGFAKKTFS